LKNIIYGNYSDIGMVRTENQDSYGVFPDGDNEAGTAKGQLFVIADGMGGHRGGKQASSIAVKTVDEIYFSSSDNDVKENLLRAIREANNRINEYTIDHPDLIGMGTTCIAMVVTNQRGYIAHVGDSRVYHITGKSITQLTKDHSKVAEMERRGLITADEARHHPERSQLYRALGTRSTVEVDMIEDIDLGANEYFVMCTDGLFNNVEKEEIRDIVLSNAPPEAAQALVQLANQRGGQDNITVQVIQISGRDSFVDKLRRVTG
jgi:PPM family protein phosphatase